MPETHRPRVGILISGRGSNMEALLAAMRDGRVPADPAVVISNVPGAAGLARAQSFGVATEVVDHTAFKPRAAHERAVLEVLDRHGVDVVCLAGYMRLLSPVLLEAYPGAILNIHPSLLPAFPGLDAQRQALDYGVKVSGCTVHLVDGELDHGPILVQRTVPVLEDDTEETLSARILEQEHLAYPEALALYASGRVRVEGRRVVLVR
jgi:phosphoribosylglycinamide formyltransferase-1